MSSMYGAVSSDWFEVRDVEAFKAFFETYVLFGDEIEIFIHPEKKNFVAFGGYEEYPYAHPRCDMDIAEDAPEHYVFEDEDDGLSVGWDLDSFADAMREHLVANEQLKVVAAGNNDLRYVGASMLIVSHHEHRFERFSAGN
jgi:hypothetical protein